jgi:hypothetical protein
MAATYEKIATTTVSSDSSTLTFSSIPSTYTDLKLILNRYANGSGSGYLTLTYNSTSGGTAYSTTYYSGNGTAVSSSRSTSSSSITVSAGGSTQPDLLILDIFSYAGSTFKHCLSQYSGDNNGATFGYLSQHVGVWRSTSAITTITLTTNAGTSGFQTNTTATLYGITAA